MKRITSVVLVALLALGAAAALGGCGLQDKAVENTTGTIDVAKDAAVKAQLMMIKTGIQAYIATSGAAPADASQATLGQHREPLAHEPLLRPAHEAGRGRGRLRLHARRRHGVHARGQPLRRHAVHGAVI